MSEERDELVELLQTAMKSNVMLVRFLRKCGGRPADILTHLGMMLTTSIEVVAMMYDSNGEQIGPKTLDQMIADTTKAFYAQCEEVNSEGSRDAN